MAQHTFFCIDGHTCGNPVRVVAGGSIPPLAGATMVERRAHFIAEYDWIRTSLMFEPRGHDIMSGSILYPPTRDDCDVAILFIETSGCLPMCGHGTIGTVTTAIERGLVRPKTPGVLMLDTPAGVVRATYSQEGHRVRSVTLTNVPSFLYAADLKTDVRGIGPITADVAYGGNFYAIIEPQPGYGGLETMDPADILRLSPLVRRAFSELQDFTHPDTPEIKGLSHVMWTGAPTRPEATARNAVFYGDKAIDRSPCGTGTSARMAQLAARGKLKQGDTFVHESIIGTMFEGRIASTAEVGGQPAIIPAISGWAIVTGLNTIFVDDADPLWAGFQVGGQNPIKDKK
jgi:4-hydroxyproline epimerase